MRSRLSILLTACVCVLLFQACGGDKVTTPAPVANPFAGAWNVVFAGNYTGGGTVNIGTNGSFSATVVLQDYTGTYSETVSGTVATNGQVQNGTISEGGRQIGTLSGNFSGNAGSGTYQTNVPTSGTWAASR